MPEGRRAAIAVEEPLGRRGILGDDPRREAGRLLVRDPHSLVEPVDERDRDRRRPIGIARPLMAERRIERLGAGHVAADFEPARAELLDELCSNGGRAPVDEQEVEPVADPEPVEARLGDRERLLARRGRVDVEHTAALGVGERSDAVLWRRAARARPWPDRYRGG